MSEPTYVTAREQDEYGYWYTRIEGSDGSLKITMDPEDFKRMMAYKLEHPEEVPESLEMFARSYENLGKIGMGEFKVVKESGGE